MQPGLDSMAAQYSPSGVLYAYTLMQCTLLALCGSGSAGLAAAHQRTHSGTVLRSKPWIGNYDDARAA